MSVTTSIGVISGIDYGTLIDDLMDLANAPVDRLTTRNETLSAEQTVIEALSTYLQTVRYTVDNLGEEDLFGQCDATTTNSSVLTATVTGDATEGTYQYTVLQTAQQGQYVSSGLSSSSQALGGGAVTIRFGDNVERSAALNELNGGEGVQRGKIRITDRSGTTAVIDLSAVQTIDDVLGAINNNDTINVTASVDGGSIVLTDNTGQTDSNLVVREVGAGSTAASLGLSGINEAADSATGEDLLQISDDTLLSTLNDGNGVQVSSLLADITYTLRDGTTGSIDFSPLGSEDEGQQETTLEDILDVINQTDPTRLQAEISSDGKRIVLTDLTSGAGTFTLESQFGSTALADLGLEGEAVDGVITGRQLVGGLKTVLLSSLNGGAGLEELGSLKLTDRSGAFATVDLSEAETLEDVIAAINASGVGITARVNDAKNGISLSDTTGSATSNMIVEDADVPSAGTAAALGIAADTADGFVNSGDLHLQVVSEDTRLDELNGGAGVALGQFKITTSSGHIAQISLANTGAETLGDVIREINSQTSYVVATMNETGDGILLVDQDHGTGTFSVADVTSTTASDLHLTGTATVGDYGGTPSNLIDGSMTYTIELDEDATLEDLQAEIEQLNMGVAAGILNDGSSTPYRLTLTSDQSGRAGRFVVDTSGIASMTMTETAAAQDALLVVGSSASTGVMVASSTNRFTGILSGVTLEVQQASSSPVTVTISASSADPVASIQAMVANYNTFRESLNDAMAYNSATDESGALQGDSAALRLDTELSNLLSGRFSSAGSVRSLGELGITINDDGTLSFDQGTFQTKFDADQDAVKEFFTTANTGFSARFSELIDQLGGADDSLLSAKSDAIAAKIEDNQERIDTLTERLAKQRERMVAEFAQVEVAIAKMQSNLDLLDSISSLWSNSSDSSSSSSSS